MGIARKDKKTGMSFFGAVKSIYRSKMDRRQMQTAIAATQARKRVEAGGQISGYNALAARDIALYPNKRVGPPRTTQYKKYGGS